jgi:hypothetical protein
MTTFAINGTSAPNHCTKKSHWKKRKLAEKKNLLKKVKNKNPIVDSNFEISQSCEAKK